MIITVIATICIGAWWGRNWIKSAFHSSSSACVANLRVVQGAKDQWAMNEGKGPTDIPTWGDLSVYMPDSWMLHVPKCPDGGVYTIGQVSQTAACSINDDWHALPLGAD
jgi:hypothetical protein